MQKDAGGAVLPPLFRYGLPLEDALRHLVDPALWLRGRFPVPSPDELAREYLAIRRRRDFWRIPAEHHAKAEAEAAARKRLAAECQRSLQCLLWKRLGARQLVAFGRLGSIAAPFAPIDPDIWPRLRVKNWGDSRVAGGNAEFHDVRIFDPAGLPLVGAASAFASIQEADELEGLEHAGYVRESFLAYGLPPERVRPDPFSGAMQERACELRGRIRAGLLDHLRTGRLTASGLVQGGAGAAARRPIPAPWWAAPDRYAVAWEQSCGEWSPDHRTLTAAEWVGEEARFADIRVHLAASTTAATDAPDDALLAIPPAMAAPSRARGAKPGAHPANQNDTRRPACMAAMKLVEEGAPSLRKALIGVVCVPSGRDENHVIRPYREQIKREFPDWYRQHVEQRGGDAAM